MYFGALEEPLAAARDALRPGGVLIFTLEALSADANYRLEAHGRYAHSERYARRALEAAGFTLDALTPETLREERGLPVPGLLHLQPRHLHHLVRSGEILGAMLMTEHNLWFYQRMMQGLREAIGEARLASHARGFLDRYRAGQKR